MNPEEMLERMAPVFGLTKIYSATGWRWGYENETPDAKTEDHDYSWTEPTQAQIDALHYVCKRLHRKVPPNDAPLTWHWQVVHRANGRALAVDAEVYDSKVFNQTEFDYAEMMLLFPGSLGYQQVKTWTTQSGPYPQDFYMGAVIFKHLIDSGYSEGVWYPATKDMKTGEALILTSFADMVKQLSGKADIISQTIRPMIALVIPKVEPRPVIGTRKCIHPECEEMVDIGKKKSGACCKAHMNFECTNSACVIRAKSHGWPRATHPFGTKIAREHWQYRKGE